MFCNALTIEYSVTKPQPDLGDVRMSPLFNRVSAACPVLSIFGNVRIPALDAKGDAGAEGLATSRDTDSATRQGPSATSRPSPLPPLSATLHSRAPPTRRPPSLPSTAAPAALSAGGASSFPKAPPGVLATPAGGGQTASRAAPTPPTIATPLDGPANAAEGVAEGSHPLREGAGAARPTSGGTAGRGGSGGGAAAGGDEGARPPLQQWSACVHVHGCYPYFLMPQYDRGISAVQFGAQLETVALRCLFERGGAEGGPTTPAAPNRQAFRAAEAVGSSWLGKPPGIKPLLRLAPPHGQLLHDVEVVEKMPFYGYHAHTYPFYKVSVIDPNHVKPIAGLLQETTEVGGRSWQLYEAHCSYHSQFMLDYDVKGLSAFELPPCHVRAPLGKAEATAKSTAPDMLPGESAAPVHASPLLDRQLRGQSAAWRLRACGILSIREPDEGEGRRTSAELELDVTASDLKSAMTLGAAAAPVAVNGATSAVGGGRAEAAAKDRGVEPGSHLTHVRALVRQYFAEYGVPDALRRARTITAELRWQEAWRRGALASTATSDAAARCDGGDAFAPRYGSAMMIQRCDPVARSLRQQMLRFLQKRLGLYESIRDEDAKPAVFVKKQESLPSRWWNPAWAPVALPAYVGSTQALAVASQPSTTSEAGEAARVPLTFELLDGMRGSEADLEDTNRGAVAAALADWSSTTSSEEDAEGEGGRRQGPVASLPPALSTSDASLSFRAGDCVVWFVECGFLAGSRPAAAAAASPGEGRDAHTRQPAPPHPRRRALVRYAAAHVTALGPTHARLQRLCGVGDDGAEETSYLPEKVHEWVRHRRWLAPAGRIARGDSWKSDESSHAQGEEAGAEVASVPQAGSAVVSLGELVVLAGEADDAEVPLALLSRREKVRLTGRPLDACQRAVRDAAASAGESSVVLHSVALLPPLRLHVASTLRDVHAVRDALSEVTATTAVAEGESAEVSGTPASAVALCRYQYVPLRHRLAVLPTPLRCVCHVCVAARGSPHSSLPKEEAAADPSVVSPETLQRRAAARLPEPLDEADAQRERGEELSRNASEDDDADDDAPVDSDGDADDGRHEGDVAGLHGCVAALVEAVASADDGHARLPPRYVPPVDAAGRASMGTQATPSPTASVNDRNGATASFVPLTVPIPPSQAPPHARRSYMISRAAERQQLALTQICEGVHFGVDSNAEEQRSQQDPIVRLIAASVEEELPAPEPNEREAGVSFRSDEPLFAVCSSPSSTSLSDSTQLHGTDRTDLMAASSAGMDHSPPSRLRIATGVAAATDVDASGLSPITIETSDTPERFACAGDGCLSGAADTGVEGELAEAGGAVAEGGGDVIADDDASAVVALSPPAPSQKAPPPPPPPLGLVVSRVGADVDGISRVATVSCTALQGEGASCGAGGGAEDVAQGVKGVLHASTGAGEAAATDGGRKANPSRSTSRRAQVCQPPPPLPRVNASVGSLPALSGSHHRSHRSASVSQLQFRICAFRGLYVEVILRRTPGASEVARDPLLAVALGSTTTDSDTMTVQLLSVCPRLAGAAASYGGATTVPGFAGRVAHTPVADERALLVRAVRAILLDDPDIIMSWEGVKYGLGSLALRYQIVLRRSLSRDLARFGAADVLAAMGDGAERAERGPGGGVPTPKASWATRETAALTATAQACAEEGMGGMGEALPRSGPFIGTAAMAEGDGREGCPFPSAASQRRPRLSSAFYAGGATDAMEPDGDEEEGWAEGVEADGADGQGDDAPHHRRTHPAVSGRETDTAGAAVAATDGAAMATHFARRFGAVVRVPGRVCRSLGRDLRNQVQAPSYSLAAMHAQVLGQSFPYFTDVALGKLFLGSAEAPAAAAADRALALSYLVGCCVAAHRIARGVRYYLVATEFSAMYGILYEEVISRGSQFRVEATLLRMARPQNYAMLSPSRLQVFHQPRIQCIPLIMQPRSGFYGADDPILVLDFRSLYPSVAIAYNLCYSTCVGMVQANTHSRLGVVVRYKQPNELLCELLPDTSDSTMTISPNGAMFVSPAVRRGVIPQMLQTVLDTRFEVQAAIQHVAGPFADAVMQERLSERQQALKLLANVTYGYTAASYTGRMPCVDVAEAIVSLGRQTLERAIALIHGTEKWGAQVVYGDTDSVFVRIGRGRTLSEAFDIGAQIAKAVTASNPVPIQLQFEKVLRPCLLVVKKRYAGYAWFSKEQREPHFFDKGIETVRRDQCPATARLARSLLTHLFDSARRAGTGVHSAAWRATLRERYRSQVAPLMRGEGNPADFIFRRAVKLGSYSDDAHLPLAAHLALQRMARDLLATPHWGERLPYVVVRSLSATQVRDQVVHPEVLLLLDGQARLDADYYIRRHFNPTLDRLFHLVGVSFASEYRNMPKGRRGRRQPLQRMSTTPPTLVLAPAMATRLHGLLAWLDKRYPRSTHEEGRRQRSTHAPGWLTALPTSSDPPDSAHSDGVPAVTVVDDIDHSEHDVDRDTQRGGAVRDEDVVAALREAAGCCKRGRAGGEGLPPRRRARHTTAPVDVNVDDGTAAPAVPSPRAGTARTPLTDMPGLPKRDSAGQKHLGKTTLEDYYPTQFCVVCNRAAVKEAEQLRPLAYFIRNHHAQRASDADSPSSTRDPPLRVPAMDSPGLTLPPLCDGCAADPQALLCCLADHARTLDRQLDAVLTHCRLCMAAAPTARGSGKATDLVDVEELAAWRERAVIALPRDRAAAVASSARSLAGPAPSAQAAPAAARMEEEAESGGDADGVDTDAPPAPENTLGCMSCDCSLNFEKRRLTLLSRQLRLLKDYVERMLA